VSPDYAVGTGVGRPCCFGIVGAQCGFGGCEGVADALTKIGSRQTRAAISERTKAALAAAKARGKRWARARDPAGAVRHMSVARRAQAAQFAVQQSSKPHMDSNGNIHSMFPAWNRCINAPANRDHDGVAEGRSDGRMRANRKGALRCK